ncbi:MAG: MATE family efflux transporter [Christensenellales bacterium]
MAIIQAISFMIGMGSGTHVSQALGAGNKKKADTYASTAFFTAFIAGIILAFFSLTHIDFIIRFLGSTETIAPYAKDYATYIFYAMPFMMCSFVMNNLLRFGADDVRHGRHHHRRHSQHGATRFSFRPEHGHGGRGAGDGALFRSQLHHPAGHVQHQGRRAFHQIFKLPSLQIYGSICYNGIPSRPPGHRERLHHPAQQRGGRVRRRGAAMSIVSRYTMFINSSVIGFGQGFQPVCGFSYGAGI